MSATLVERGGSLPVEERWATRRRSDTESGEAVKTEKQIDVFDDLK